MQFSIVSLVAALAATATASYVPAYGYHNTTSVAYVPEGTAAPTGVVPSGVAPSSVAPSGAIPSGTGSYGTGVPVPNPSNTGAPEFPGAASKVSGSAFAIVVAGGVALMM